MQNYDIFCQLKSRLATRHTIASKWKDKYDAVVADSIFSQQLAIVWCQNENESP